MAIITSEQVRLVVGEAGKQSLVEGFVAAINEFGAGFRMNEPHQLAHFIAQVGHESDSFQTWQEYASGAAYEGRKDLGNTQKGDGRRFKGRGPIQFTGRANYRWFAKWCQSNGYSDAPDFEAKPKEMATSRWGTLAALAYWRDRRKDIPRFADDNNIEMVTRRVNGGLNGYSHRIELYGKAALALLGYQDTKTSIEKFQRSADMDDVDGLIGPKTRRELHLALKGDREDSLSDHIPAHEQIVGASSVTYTNQNATRNKPVTPVLEARIGEMVSHLVGPGGRAEIYSGGQDPKGKGRRRTGSIRHDATEGGKGRAADVYLYGPDNKRIVGGDLAPFVQYWAAEKIGGVGAQMRGGGLHVDEWSTPPKGGGMFWTYGDRNSALNSQFRAAFHAGQAGEKPPRAPRPQPPKITQKPGKARQSAFAAIIAIVSLAGGWFAERLGWDWTPSGQVEAPLDPTQIPKSENEQ